MKDLAAAVKAVQEPLSKVASKVATSDGDSHSAAASPVADGGHVLGGALGAASLAAAGGAGFGIARAAEPEDDAHAHGAGLVPFYGEHQAGIATPAQDRLAFAAFDVTTSGPRRAAGAAGASGRRPRRR